MDFLSPPKLTTRTIDVIPHAASLIEGHRDFGYNLETALADIIDNSISSGATCINLHIDVTTEEPWIALADDGCGMTEPELIEAMRLGTKNPTDERAAKELGRFGLGLKSASFSQCRCLTVLTRRHNITSCARWDLDRIANLNSWTLELPSNVEKISGYKLLPATGTVVIWKKLDRLSDSYTDDREKRITHMNAEFSRAERHLKLVFHRFIEGSKPQLKLLLNGRQLEPLDPMVSFHPSTQRTPEEIISLPKGDVRIRCYTLPHHRRMTKDEWEDAGGSEGHLKSQGLYVYRENRLIIAGSWLGLTKQTELTKLCRIAIDIPNSMDSEWKIDVKKSSTQLPSIVRERLKKIIERFVGTSKRIYRSRGQKLVDTTLYPIWNRIQKNDQIIFRPNLEHPVFLSYLEKLPEELREGFECCLRLVGSGLPIETLYTELIGNAESVASDSALESDLKQVVNDLAKVLIDNGVAIEKLSDSMQSYHLFRANWDVVKLLINDFVKEQVI
ncbi:ATP-binding protein [Xenorhabdus bovienii]|uniref:ATP-binding protein n=1 Tax=Xenorhabdus bovienii TaxID=40576 RepID=UPI0023B27430|nr:ATP-binding protein [Xenorhabdus bovienii]MDE9457924.1 ATP-binding protein [Xenorhabdus bovienii]MDE9486195.1 ATP-binding protein [Xenorhabdus bovienii]MDE9513990.1 ATP-binding protein [Xenorhabdus bovienii]